MLRVRADELQALIEAVVVPETWFFRDPECLRRARPAGAEWLPAQLNGVRSLRILSLPCSTGEEPYSMAMALLDAGCPPAAFSIEAVDISPLSIAARAPGRCTARIPFAASDLGFRERHFSAVEEGYRLRGAVREQVRFQPGNLFDRRLLPGAVGLRLHVLPQRADLLRPSTPRSGLRRAEAPDCATTACCSSALPKAACSARMGMVSIGIAQSFAFRRRAEPLPESARCRDASDAAVRRAHACSAATSVAQRRYRRPLHAPDAAFAPLSHRFAPARRTAMAAVGLAPAKLRPCCATSRLWPIKATSPRRRRLCEQYLQALRARRRRCSTAGPGPRRGRRRRARPQGYYRKALYSTRSIRNADPPGPAAGAQGDSAGARRLQERARAAVHQRRTSAMSRGHTELVSDDARGASTTAGTASASMATGPARAGRARALPQLPGVLGRGHRAARPLPLAQEHR